MNTQTTKAEGKSRRGRKLSAVPATTDPTGCVMHHIRIHHSLDKILRAIVSKRGISFRDASEEAMVAWANANGVKIEMQKVEIMKPETETRFVVTD